MMKCALVGLSMFFGLASAFAAPTSYTSDSDRPKSSKKAEADRSGLTAPQVIEVGDSLLGVRANAGTTYDNTVVGLNYEKILSQNFGLGALFGYSSYNTNYNYGGISGKFDYNVMTAAVTGNLHADVLKVRNLDTFLTLGLGYTWLSHKWSSNSGFDAPATGADTNSTFVVAYINGRYFVNSTWAVTASLGTGLGTLGVGMDYLF